MRNNSNKMSVQAYACSCTSDCNCDSFCSCTCVDESARYDTKTYSHSNDKNYSKDNYSNFQTMHQYDA